ncbi:MAG: UDP-2,3-diacylglucosamine diphosphatase LpxI [Pseudomonadota bacterium]
MAEPAPPIAIVAGSGDLPRLLAEACQRRARAYHIVQFDGVSLPWRGDHPRIDAVFEKPGALFATLRRLGVREVTFAGAMRRPTLSPQRFDLKALAIAPRVLSALRRGDDAGLSVIAAVFEGEGLAIVPPETLLEEGRMPAGVLTRTAPSRADAADILRARQILAALGPLDVGQGAVVAQGLCLGVETVQGTDAMLRFVAKTAGPLRPDPDGARGVLVKCPKPGQDRRVDLPAIGPDTIRAVDAAGLAGVALTARGALLLNRAETVAEADRRGLFLIGDPA